jgi:hypothetical protein
MSGQGMVPTDTAHRPTGRHRDSTGGQTWRQHRPCSGQRARAGTGTACSGCSRRWCPGRRFRSCGSQTGPGSAPHARAPLVTRQAHALGQAPANFFETLGETQKRPKYLEKLAADPSSAHHEHASVCHCRLPSRGVSSPHQASARRSEAPPRGKPPKEHAGTKEAHAGLTAPHGTDLSA